MQIENATAEAEKAFMAIIEAVKAVTDLEVDEGPAGLIAVSELLGKVQNAAADLGDVAIESGRVAGDCRQEATDKLLAIARWN